MTIGNPSRPVPPGREPAAPVEPPHPPATAPGAPDPDDPFAVDPTAAWNRAQRQLAETRATPDPWYEDETEWLDQLSPPWWGHLWRAWQTIEQWIIDNRPTSREWQ